MRSLITLIAVLVWGLGAFGCSKEDTGQCCEVLDPAFMDRIPKPDPNDVGPNGEPRNVIRLDPKFDCDNLTCVSYKGSEAYCTKECAFDDGCPEGFRCDEVIESDPGPEASIKKGTKFCVRDAKECLAE